MMFYLCLFSVGNNQFTDNYDVYQKNLICVHMMLESIFNLTSIVMLKKDIYVSPNFGLYRFSLNLVSVLRCFQQAAFPAQEKRLDALLLCATEVFIYLEENLKLEPQNLSDKAVALDELEEMHQQVWIQGHHLTFGIHFLFA